MTFEPRHAPAGAPALSIGLEEAKQRVDAAILEHLDARAMPALLKEAMAYAVLGPGKRLRPFILIEVSRMFAVEPGLVLKAACAVECIHAYSLIHDDLPCMDDDDQRRGRPTVHRAFGEPVALLAGDALQALAFDLLLDARSASGDDKARLALGLARAAGGAGMVGGQILDMTNTGSDHDTLVAMQRLKTGALFEYAAQAPVALGKATGRRQEALTTFGRAFGLGYQIADDLMDAQGDQAVAGKAVQKDAARGKANLVTAADAAHARRHLDRLAAESLEALAAFGPEAQMLRQATDRFLAAPRQDVAEA